RRWRPPGPPPTPPCFSAPGSSRARSRAYSAWARATASANSGSVSNRSFSLEIQPSASTRETARTASGHASQNVVGNGSPCSSTGALRMTRGCPPGQRATTVNGTVGWRPSCSATIRRSLPRSSPTAGALLALVFDGALEVHLALLALAHELLQAGLEVRVRAAALTRGRGILQRLDREVDLAVLLDGDHLRLDDVALAQVLVHVLDVVPVDLGDVDESHLPALQGQEGAVRGDAADGPVDDRADLKIFCQNSSVRSVLRWSFLSGASPISPVSHRLVCARNNTARGELA